MKYINISWPITTLFLTVWTLLDWKEIGRLFQRQPPKNIDTIWKWIIQNEVKRMKRMCPGRSVWFPFSFPLGLLPCGDVTSLALHTRTPYLFCFFSSSCCMYIHQFSTQRRRQTLFRSWLSPSVIYIAAEKNEEAFFPIRLLVLKKLIIFIRSGLENTYCQQYEPGPKEKKRNKYKYLVSIAKDKRYVRNAANVSSPCLH